PAGGESAGNPTHSLILLRALRLPVHGLAIAERDDRGRGRVMKLQVERVVSAEVAAGGRLFHAFNPF
ncbi:MAG TPA: hypothetical protein VJG32_11860, partial [Anaerolineae bacterium]|nr:hypothetical protein [Anaerolineae bacterium]